MQIHTYHERSHLPRKFSHPPCRYLPDWVVAMASVKQPLCIAKIREYVTRSAPQLTAKIPEREAHRRRVLGAQLALQQEVSAAATPSLPLAIAAEPANATTVVATTAALAPAMQQQEQDAVSDTSRAIPLAVDVNAQHPDDDSDQKHELPDGSWYPANAHACMFMWHRF